MPNDQSAPEGRTLGTATPTTTQVPWAAVTGIQLEELLYGLLDAMSASSLAWRAGSTSGITASDGGRDMEVIFDRPSPDGELERQTWWVECKGRSGTVERSAVQEAVLDAGARSDIDVLVVATNSRFSNPTRDWVTERARSFTRPVVKLWDRDSLDRLVRRYPTVMARVLPQVLPDEERLQLLVGRFEEIGEEPALLDLDFFWERRDWLREQESWLVSRAIAMFLYAEGVTLPRVRQWWLLLQQADIPDSLITALIRLPNLLFKESLPRSLEDIRALASAARIVTTCLTLLPDAALEMTLNPWGIVVNGDRMTSDEEAMQGWRMGTLKPILAFIQSDLLEACSGDCTRMTADNPHETPSLGRDGFWGALFKGTSDPSDEVIIIEIANEPCTVGLDMNFGCPLLVSNDHTCERLVRDITTVLQFRQAYPADMAAKGKPFRINGPAQLILLGNHGMSWRTTPVGNETGQESGQA